MQRILNQPTAFIPILDQLDAQQAANTYLTETFGHFFCANHGVLTQVAWRFLIQYQSTMMSKAIVVGRLDVHAHDGLPFPLSTQEITLVQERCAILTADLASTTAVDANGFVSLYLAKRNVKAYLGHHISLFAQPMADPQWIDGDPPRWRVTILLQRRDQTSQPLGYLDVNALTGVVISPTEIQLQAMQRHVQNAVVSSPSPTRATG